MGTKRIGPSGRPHGRRALRPTSSRVRTALFDSLAGVTMDAVVLDLFAGSGALGMEALRRGARRAVFVERNPAQCRSIRRGLLREGLADHGDVRCEDVLAGVEHLQRAGEIFDLVLLDPPYGEGWIERTLEGLARTGILRPGGLVVAEGHWRDRPRLASGLSIAREARYGETALWYIRIESGQ